MCISESKTETMRVVYLSEYSACQMSGVIKKILGQTRVWRRLGHEVRLALVSSPCKSIDPAIGEAGRVFSSTFVSSLTGPPNTYINKILSSEAVRRFVVQFKPDYIYYRDGLWYPGLERILSLAHYIIEVNTVTELELTGPRRWLHRMTKRRLYSHAAGIVAVTNEIASSLRHYNKQAFFFPNGIDTEQLRPRLPPSNTRPALIFAGTPGQRWHGVDKLLIMARKLPEFVFHVVGPSKVADAPPNIRFHGYASPEKLSELYNIADVGIGTLALHRIGMREAAPLKVREYLAYGLPTIIAYDDPALRGLDCVLQLPNEEDLTPYTGAIREFVYSWAGKPISRREVLPRIDLAVIEEEKIARITQLLRGQEKQNA